MLDRLVQQGLIQRTENPDDRRVKQISLTEKGAEKFQESLRARTDWLAELAEMLTVSEKEDVEGERIFKTLIQRHCLNFYPPRYRVSVIMPEKEDAQAQEEIIESLAELEMNL